MIPYHPILPTKYMNLLNNHGELDLEDVLRFEKSYINSPTRAAQDTNMLYHCLIISLSKVRNTKVMVWEYQYKIKGRPSRNLLSFLQMKIQRDFQKMTQKQLIQREIHRELLSAIKTLQEMYTLNNLLMTSLSPLQINQLTLHIN